METVDLVSGIVQTVIALGDVVAKAAPTHRQCDIEIINDSSTYTLCNPKVYTTSGRCAVPLPPKIQQSNPGRVLFTKTPFTATGSVGIFTYDLISGSEEAATERLAVMFKVPFDLKRKANIYAVGVFDISKECDRDLYQEMSKNVETTFVRGKAKGPALSFKSQNVTIEATMSDCYQPVIKVQVSSNEKNAD